ncbi:MAG TPA: hypothetical protein VMV01_02635 [Planctomycetota bacterium]|nr:hypothetical protein [Planctomycetota bacterium]
MALAQQNQETEPAVAPGGSFQTLAFNELLGIAPPPGLTFPVEIPAGYRERRASSSTTGSMVWVTPADWSLIRRGRPASGRHGMLVVQRSNSLQYDEERDEFRDGTGLSEGNLPERLEKRGASRVAVRRVDRGDVPMLLLEADLDGNEHLRVVYVQLGPRARSLSYIGHVPWNAHDERAWAQLRDSIAPP